MTTSNLQKNLTPDERRDILGEAAPNAPARSVFDYIPLKAQQRLEHLIAQAKEKTTRTIPRTESTVAAAALKGFMPFDNAPEKQARYRLYLEVMSTADSDESSEKALVFINFLTCNLDPSPQYIRNQADIPDGELKEFSQSALMYRPLSNLMASRFTSATKPDIINYKEHANEKAQKESKVQAESQKSLVRFLMKSKTSLLMNLQDETEAGKRDMFGALTRSVSEWRPDRLLCKRFGVPNPYQVDSQGQVEEDKRQEELDKEMLNDRTMEKLMKERDRQFLDPESSIRTGEESSEGLGMAKPGRQVGINEEDEDEEPPVEKPSLDIFKAIFADSDDEEDIEDEEVRDLAILFTSQLIRICSALRHRYQIFSPILSRKPLTHQQMQLYQSTHPRTHLCRSSNPQTRMFQLCTIPPLTMIPHHLLLPNQSPSLLLSSGLHFVRNKNEANKLAILQRKLPQKLLLQSMALSRSPSTLTLIKNWTLKNASLCHFNPATILSLEKGHKFTKTNPQSFSRNRKGIRKKKRKKGKEKTQLKARTMSGLKLHPRQGSLGQKHPILCSTRP